MTPLPLYYTHTLEPARARATEMLALERTVSDLVDLAYALTPEEIELMWTSARRKEPGGSRPTEDGIVRAFPLL